MLAGAEARAVTYIMIYSFSGIVARWTIGKSIILKM